MGSDSDTGRFSAAADSDVSGMCSACTGRKRGAAGGLLEW